MQVEMHLLPEDLSRHLITMEVLFSKHPTTMEDQFSNKHLTTMADQFSRHLTIMVVLNSLNSKIKTLMGLPKLIPFQTRILMGHLKQHLLETKTLMDHLWPHLLDPRVVVREHLAVILAPHLCFTRSLLPT